MSYILETGGQCVGKGYFSGKLFHINDEYPGAIHIEGVETKVFGQLFTINPEAYQQVMRLFDRYERFKEDDAENSLFVRTVVNIQTAEHQVPCWVYLYNKDTEGLTEISSGYYWQFLKEKNLHKKQ